MSVKIDKGQIISGVMRGSQELCNALNKAMRTRWYVYGGFWFKVAAIYIDRLGEYVAIVIPKSDGMPVEHVALVSILRGSVDHPPSLESAVHDILYCYGILSPAHHPAEPSLSDLEMHRQCLYMST